MHRWLSNICQKYSNRVLVRPSFRYKDLEQLSKRKKEDFVASNIQRGNRVLLSEYNSVEFLAKMKALWDIGATPCLVSPKLLGTKKDISVKLLLETQTSEVPEALLLLTSGTSSKYPKGVRLSHHNITSHVDILGQYIPSTVFDANDRTFSFLPWTHCYGLMGECFSVMDRGSSMAILSPCAQRRFSFPVFFRDLQLCQPTILFVVPYLLEVILKRDHHMRKLITNTRIRKSFWFGNNIKYIVSGGAYLSPETRKAFFDEFDLEILQGYGCTEMSPMISLQKQFDPKDVSVGEILPHVQVDIRKGEVWVNGPNRFMGYVGEPDPQSADFYNTKDQGYVENNKLYLTGRTSNILKLSNGKFIDVHDFENKLKTIIPSCEDVCVWREDDHRLYAVAHVKTDVLPKEQYTRGVLRYRCYDQEVTTRLQKTSFLSTEDGTMTPKGEKCRPMIASVYHQVNRS